MNEARWWRNYSSSTPMCFGTREPRESEPLTPFYEASCTLQPTARVQASVLYRAYVKWTEEYFVKGRLTQTAFGKEVRKRFSAEEKRTISYLGIGLRACSDTESGLDVITR